jgi:acyl carrier protein
MRSYDESLEATCELLRRHVVDGRPIHPQDHIQNDLGLDSIDVMELVSDVEARFDVNIPSEMFERIATLEDVARAVTALQR